MDLLPTDTIQYKITIIKKNINLFCSETLFELDIIINHANNVAWIW